MPVTIDQGHEMAAQVARLVRATLRGRVYNDLELYVSGWHKIGDGKYEVTGRYRVTSDLRGRTFCVVINVGPDPRGHDVEIEQLTFDFDEKPAGVSAIASKVKTDLPDRDSLGERAGNPFAVKRRSKPNG